MVSSPRLPPLRRGFERLSEAEARRADILIVCRGCRRRELFDRATFLAVLNHKNIADERERVARRMTCRKCYTRGALVELVPEGAPAALRLREGDPLPPRGVSISDWCRAGSAARRRLVRQARD